MDLYSEYDEDFDWDFNDGEQEIDDVYSLKQDKLKLLHGCMRDELRETKMDIASIAECHNKILRLNFQKKKVTRCTKFPSKLENFDDFTPCLKKQIDAETEEPFGLSV